MSAKGANVNAVRNIKSGKEKSVKLFNSTREVIFDL